MVNYHIYNRMNSPQPLSASQRGARNFTPPSFACKDWGDEYMEMIELLYTIIIHYQ